MSSVNAVNNSSTSDTDTSTRIPTKTLSQADFLKVLIAQYSNQIPSDSQDSTAFYKNMMEMSNYQATQDVSTKVSAMTASQMVGEYVSATKTDSSATGITKTGTITAATFDGTDWYYVVDGESFKPTQVTKVTTTPTTTTTTQ